VKKKRSKTEIMGLGPWILQYHKSLEISDNLIEKVQE